MNPHCHPRFSTVSLHPNLLTYTSFRKYFISCGATAHRTKSNLLSQVGVHTCHKSAALPSNFHTCHAHWPHSSRPIPIFKHTAFPTGNVFILSTYLNTKFQDWADAGYQSRPSQSQLYCTCYVEYVWIRLSIPTLLKILPAKFSGSKIREGGGVATVGSGYQFYPQGIQRISFLIFYVTALKKIGDRDHIHPSLFFCRRHSPSPSVPS